MRSIATASLALAALLSCSHGLCAQLPHPGSVLIYPNHKVFASILAVTNADTTPGASVVARFSYVNATPTADPFQPICQTSDRLEFLTAGDTFSVMSYCHNAAGQAPAGYLVVTALDTNSLAPISHNHLMGSLINIETGGALYSMNAIPFSSPLPAGDKTDVNNNGQLDFDSIEYQEIPDVLMVDRAIPALGPRLTLLNLTGGPLADNTVSLVAWNDNEFALSATRRFRCWFDQPLSNVAPFFTQAFLTVTPHDPTELDLNCNGVGEMETVWFRIDSIDVTHPVLGNLSSDGALLGSLYAVSSVAGAGRGLWADEATQRNGSF